MVVLFKCSEFILLGRPAAINVALAFNMGKDMESIVSNPIGQPMATVRPSLLLFCRVSQYADSRIGHTSDPVQQSRS